MRRATVRHGDIFPIHGAKMTPLNGRGASRAFPTENRSKPSPEWNHYRITCVDGKISLAVNGKLVTQAHPSIATKEHFADFGFIFDLRRSEKSKVTRVLLRGATEGAIEIDPEDPMMAKHLAIGRGWNRFEGTLKQNKLTLILNGAVLFTDRLLPGIAALGPIRLVPTGPVDFANVYVRSLE